LRSLDYHLAYLNVARTGQSYGYNYWLCLKSVRFRRGVIANQSFSIVLKIL